MPELTFKTAEEQQKALDGIETDAPVGVNIDTWESETNQKIDEIMNAKIDENPPADPPADPPPPQDPPKNPIDLTPNDPPPADPTAPDVNAELEQLRRNNEYLQQQNRANERDSQNDKSDMQKQIDDLKAIVEKGPAVNPKEKAKTEVDHELLAVQDEIKALEVEMNKEDDDDDPDHSTSIKQLKKHGQLQLKLNALKEKKQADVIKQQNKEISELKNTQRLKKEKQDEDELEAKRNTAVEKFRESIPELQGDKKFEDMHREYSEFSVEVAAAYFNIPAKKVLMKDAEVAMAKYLEGSEILNQALDSRGIVEPEDMRKFVVLSEVDAVRQGYVLDKVAGEYVQLKDSFGNPVTFPSHKAAYLHLQDEKGDYGKNILAAQRSATKNMMHAMTRKEPIELTSKEQRGENLDDMTKERAMEIFEKYDITTITLRARKDFKDPLVSEYNKALNKLGHAVITEEDL